MSDEALKLSGDLTLREVPDIWRQHRRRFHAGRLPQRVDLSGIGRTDSSALALLLEWQAIASGRDSKLIFDNPPESLQVIARLTDVEQLLGWNAQSREGHPGK